MIEAAALRGVVRITHALPEKHILKEVLRNFDDRASLTDTFRSRKGYYTADNADNADNALIVRITGTTPLRVRLNL